MIDNSGLDIFIATSLKYPELNAVKYQADKDRIILEVALNGNIITQQRKRFIEKTVARLSILHKLSQKTPLLLELAFKEVSGMTFLRFYRDIKSLTEEEIELFILFLREDFSDLLLGDKSTIITEDSFKRKVKKNLLQKIIKDNNDTTIFFANREEGRVFVYNK